MAKKTPDNNSVPGASEDKMRGRMRGELDKPVVLEENAPQADQSADKKVKKTAKSAKSDKPNIFKRMWKGLKGVISELKKVTWPKGKDVVKSTAVVLVVVIAFFVVLFGIDYVLSGLSHLVVDGTWTSIVG